MTKPEQRQLAVLGSPIEHSKSPQVHRAAYELMELPWNYGSYELKAADLQPFLGNCGPEWLGLSLTMPLKEEAHRLAVVRDPVAEQSGVVNTLLQLAGDAGWAGFNTDVAGLASAIDRAGLDVAHTVVLGSGATAVSAILAVQRLGAKRVEILARNAVATADLADRFDLGLFSAGEPASATLVVSTLPGPASAEVELPSDLLQIPLFDVAYDPWPSPLALRWEAAGTASHSGLEMLVEQAIIQIRIFRNGDPDTALPDEEEVRAAMQHAVQNA